MALTHSITAIFQSFRCLSDISRRKWGLGDGGGDRQAWPLPRPTSRSVSAAAGNAEKLWDLFLNAFVPNRSRNVEVRSNCMFYRQRGRCEQCTWAFVGESFQKPTNRRCG